MRLFATNHSIETLCNEKGIWIYGTGKASDICFTGLTRLLGEKFDSIFLGFLSPNPNGTFKEYQINDIQNVKKDELILIMANPEYRIEKRLESIGHNNWIYIDPIFLSLYTRKYYDSCLKSISDNKEKIDEVYNMLKDEKSKAVFKTLISHRINHSIESLLPLFDNGQYFSNDIIPYIDGNIVDCGAYVGDTLKRFLSQIRSNNFHYFACEPDKDNCYKIRKYCNDNNIDSVDILEYAVWDRETDLYFKNDESEIKTNGKIDNLGNKCVKGNSLDNLLNGKSVDMITMDIEGAEINALYGAKEVIRNNKPILAISTYHELEHFWKIPLLIKEYDSNYDIYFRHHCWNLSDTICYAIPK